MSTNVSILVRILAHVFFFEKKIYFHKTNLQKNHIYNTKHTIYKRKEIKAKKRLEILKILEIFNVEFGFVVEHHMKHT